MYNKKARKIFIIVLAAIIGTLGVAIAICYFVIPDLTKHYAAIAWDWVNHPLPVVGVSALFIAFFIWKVFVSTSYGHKKYNELLAKFKELYDLYLLFVEERNRRELEWQEKYKKLDAKYKALKDYTTTIKLANPSKKVREIPEITEDEEKREEETNN